MLSVVPRSQSRHDEYPRAFPPGKLSSGPQQPSYYPTVHAPISAHAAIEQLPPRPLLLCLPFGLFPSPRH